MAFLFYVMYYSELLQCTLLKCIPTERPIKEVLRTAFNR